MFQTILTILASILSPLAVWYVSKKVTGWIQYFVSEWAKKKSQAQDKELAEQKASLDEIQKKNKVTIGELLAKKYEKASKGSVPPADS